MGFFMRMTWWVAPHIRRLATSRVAFTQKNFSGIYTEKLH